jgi:hypothetical protein
MATTSPICKVKVGGVRCPRPVALRKHGLCAAHYKRFVRTGMVGTPVIGKWQRLREFKLDPRSTQAVAGRCRILGCKNAVLYPTLGLCRGHYSHARHLQLAAGNGAKLALRPIRPRKAQARRREKALT